MIRSLLGKFVGDRPGPQQPAMHPNELIHALQQSAAVYRIANGYVCVGSTGVMYAKTVEEVAETIVAMEAQLKLFLAKESSERYGQAQIRSI
jgi:hypothetical protein